MAARRCKGRTPLLQKKAGPSRRIETGPKVLRKLKTNTESDGAESYFFGFFGFFLPLQPHVLHIVALLLNKQFGEPPTTRAAAPRALTLTQQYST